MRHLAAALAMALAACGDHDDPTPLPAAHPILVTDAASGLTAVSAVGARNVRVLILRDGGVVRLREVFMPDGEVVTRVQWADGARVLVVTTDAERFALDSRSGRLARMAAPSRGVATTTPSRRGG